LFLSCNGDFDELFMDSLDSIFLTNEKEWRRKNYTNQCWLITSVKLFVPFHCWRQNIGSHFYMR
jgi:hypothetical protein